MSLFKDRLLFGNFTDDNSKKIRFSLNDNISDDEGNDSGRESSLQDASMESIPTSPVESPRDHNSSIGFGDSGFFSPVPASTPAPVRSRSRLSKMKDLPAMSMKLDYESDLSDCEIQMADGNLSDENCPLSPPPSPKPTRGRFTPPHKGMRALRLFDTPHTPKSLLEKAQRRVVRSKLTVNGENTRSPSPSERLQANINPFTPTPDVVAPSIGKKRTRRESDFSFLLEDSRDGDREEMPNKKIALHEINTSRYNEEFYEVSKLGVGEYGSVHKCINRLDGCAYAIKKSKTPVAGSAYERNAMNEVYAHAVLGKHSHVVRYFSAWAERDHMYIQNEFCNGGSLADSITENVRAETTYSEAELKQILLQLAKGLKYIHSLNLVHLDIKPGNIFINRNPHLSSPMESVVEEDSCDQDMFTEPITYKIGDLGHVTSITNPSVEEGDCRYLPNEILQEEFTHLTKADIFSLALTIYVAGGGGPLPKNGDEWHAIRAGQLPALPCYSDEFNCLLNSMVHPDPRVRPSAATLIHHPTVCPFAKKSRAMLRMELNQEKFKNEILSRKLQAAESNKPESEKRAGQKSRLVGKKINRSMSLTVF